MDDYNISLLHQSRDELCARLLTLMTPLVKEGFFSIFDQAVILCKESGEPEKYLMTFQNLVAHIPKWNDTTIEQEKKRIIDKANCPYLEEMLAAVHINQLKALSVIRVSTKQKKIDIDIPKIDVFIHKAYIHSARRLYKNAYLFEVGIPPLQIQKHNREMELLIQEAVLQSIRESVPVESILRAYLDETTEEAIEVTEEAVETPVSAPVNPISFNDTDKVMDVNGVETDVTVPKTVENLELIGQMRHEQRKEADAEDGDGDSDQDHVKLGDKIDFDLDITTI